LNHIEVISRNKDVIQKDGDQTSIKPLGDLLYQWSKELSNQIRRQRKPEGKDVELILDTIELETEPFREFFFQFEMQEAICNVDFGTKLMRLPKRKKRSW